MNTSPVLGSPMQEDFDYDVNRVSGILNSLETDSKIFSLLHS